MIYSQSALPALLGSSGGYISNTSGELDYTIGEVSVATFENTNDILTQGFLQGNIDNPNGLYSSEILASLKLYPNPTSDLVQIAGIENIASGYTTITNNLGQMISTVPLTKGKIDVSNLPAGLYTFKLFDANHELLLTDKLLKL